jgi:subtilase family serine protease
LKRSITALFTLAILFLIAVPASADSSRSALKGSTPPWANAANKQSSADPAEWVNFRVYLGLSDPSAAESLARAVSDPRNASYGKYLSPSQFNARFAPSGSNVSAVSSWLQGQGFSVVFVPSNNHYVAAEGTVAQVEAAFGTKLGRYKVNGKSLRAPASDLLVPTGLIDAIAGIVGIDQSNALFEPMIADAPPAGGFRNAPPCSTYWAEKTTANTQVEGQFLPDYNGSPRPFAPCGYAGAQLQGAYGVASAIASGNNGAGVTVAVIDAYASPTIASDANTYFSRHGIPTFTSGQFTQVVAPGTYNHPESLAQDPQGWYGEETLDVEAVHTMAPGANVVYVGAANNYQDLDAALNHVVARHLADIVTNSYGFSSEFLPPGYIKPYNDTFIQAAIEGIGLYFSSGDGGDETFGGPASTATADWPASSPWVTAVGGTSLAVTQANTNLFETGWGTNRIRLNCNGFIKANGSNSWCGNSVYLYGSGGGTSRLFAQPSYQAGVVPASLATRWSSTPARVIPDIAAVGDPNTGMLIGQTQTFSTGAAYGEFRIGGTSLSSPLMAGIMAVAQQRKGSRIGFANPTIYSLPPSAFHDITDPATQQAVVRADFANGEDATNGILYSVRTFNVTFTLHTIAGYDDVTGRGTPNDTFLSAVAGH